MSADLVRRLIDITGSSVGLVLLSPLLVLVAAAVKVESRGPVLHVAQRVGRGGKTFSLYKFRSMVVGAERLGPGLTAADDGRVTRVGRLLRGTKLDELPQLINVLRGDMSLVGPRPEDPRYVALYTPEQRQTLSVRPGITGAASLAYKDESSLLTGEDWERRYVLEILPHKLEIELDYLARRTIAGDLRLVALTLLGFGRLSLPARERGV